MGPFFHSGHQNEGRSAHMARPVLLLALLVVLLSLDAASSRIPNPFKRRRRRSPPPPPTPLGYSCNATTGQCQNFTNSTVAAADCQKTCAPPGPCNAPKLVRFSFSRQQGTSSRPLGTSTESGD